ATHSRAFGSRIASVLAAPGFAPTVDPAAVHDYLNFKFIPAPGTPFRGIQRLLPGHLLHLRTGGADLEAVWALRYPEARAPRADAESAVYRLTRDAVGEAIRDLTPKEAGAFLSGGTDSSTVVGLMTEVTGEPVNSFSIGFSEAHYDELRYADLTARHFG